MATTVEPFTFDPITSNESPPKRRRKWPYVLGGLFVLLVAGAIAAGVYVRSAFPSSKIGVRPAGARALRGGGLGGQARLGARDGHRGRARADQAHREGLGAAHGHPRRGREDPHHAHGQAPAAGPGWLVGSEEHLHYDMTTPKLGRQDALDPDAARQARAGRASACPCAASPSGAATRSRSSALARPRRVVSLPRSLTSSNSGSIRVASAARTYERTGKPVRVTWFPTGAPLAAVLQPALGKTLTPMQPLTLRLSRPIASVLANGADPKLTPSRAGHVDAPRRPHARVHAERHRLPVRPHDLGRAAEADDRDDAEGASTSARRSAGTCRTPRSGASSSCSRSSATCR